MKHKSLIGQRFGKWTVLGRVENKRNLVRYKCECDCGKQKEQYGFKLKDGDTKSCGCDMIRLNIENQPIFIGNLNKDWKGCGEISGSRFADIRAKGTYKRKSRKNIEFTITIEYIWNLFLVQERKCALSGIDISFPKSHEKRSIGTASLDRIDNKKGYVPGNVQWVHKDVNRMKNVFDEAYFKYMCQKISFMSLRNRE